MKTIRQIAEEIGVSKQAVYKRYKGKLNKSVLPYARRVCDTVYILEQGETIIKQDFSGDTVSYGVHTEYTPDTLISMLKNELDIKNQQINEQQKTIKDLTAVIKTQTKPKNKVYPFKKRVSKKPTSVPIQRLAINRKS